MDFLRRRNQTEEGEITDVHNCETKGKRDLSGVIPLGRGESSAVLTHGISIRGRKKGRKPRLGLGPTERTSVAYREGR